MAHGERKEEGVSMSSHRTQTSQVLLLKTRPTTRCPGITPGAHLAWDPPETFRHTEAELLLELANPCGSLYLLGPVQPSPRTPSPRVQTVCPLLTNHGIVTLPSQLLSSSPEQALGRLAAFVPSAASSRSQPRSNFSVILGFTFPDTTLECLLLNQLKKAVCHRR